MKLQIKVADPVHSSGCHIGRRYTLVCQPNSSKQQIQTDLDGKITKVFLKKPAKENKANIELEKLLSKHLKAKVKIIKGHTSKTKTIEVTQWQ